MGKSSRTTGYLRGRARVPAISFLVIALAILVFTPAVAAASGTSGTGVLVPTVTSITPPQGALNNNVSATIQGTGFTGVTAVWLSRTGQPNMTCTNVVVVSTNEITCNFAIPGNAELGKWDVNVQTSVLGTGAQLFEVVGVWPPPTPAPTTWYLAEGSTAWGFDCYISVMNPNNAETTVAVTYMTASGLKNRADILIPKMSQATINPREDLGNVDFSTKVESKDGLPICVDRTMTWTGTGAKSPEAHCSVGVPSPEMTWYLPEGSSEWGFECWLLIQNPSTTQDANCTVTYMIENEGAKVVPHTVAKGTRQSFNMETDIGKKDASIKVESPVPVIPERAMYRNNRREGHDSIGTTMPARTYYLAEGTTDWGFTTYVLVQNPNPSATEVTITYMTPSGAKPQPAFSMPASSRKTIRLNDEKDVKKTDVSTQVSANQDIIAERAMYWDNGTGEACHDSIGIDNPHESFLLPDGQTSEGKETWTLVQNPGTTPLDVTITYLTPDGTGNQVVTDQVPALSRRTFNMADKIKSGRASVLVNCSPMGIVERAMYWNNRGVGTDTVGGWYDPMPL